MKSRPTRFSTTIITLIALLLLSPVVAGAQTSTRRDAQRARETRTARYFDSIRAHPLLLAAFLREMPKGADLHNHLSGAIYAESFLRWAAEADICIDQTSLSAVPCSGGDPAAKPIPADQVLNNPVMYRSVVDAWSMRNWDLSGQSGHDHFFDTFGRFGYAGYNRTSDMLAEAVKRATRDRISYLELMLTPDNGRSSALGRKLGWNDDFAKMRDALLANGLRDSLMLAVTALDSAEAGMRRLLGCSPTESGANCGMPIRYLFQVGRGGAPESVFAQILAGFEMADIDPRMVGFNLVQPEDYPVPLRDFDLQMRMIDFLRPLYRNAHISLHAGELAPGLVPPEELCCHIRRSIELGHAERIGHGVDIAYEDDPFGLLRLMAERNVMVEICLTSNDVILGVRGNHHPLSLYRQYNVPMALATDDEGVSRIDLTNEFVKAAMEQGVGYLELKRMARNSLHYSFLPGKSLWSNPATFEMTRDCSGAIPLEPSTPCRAFLNANPKAKLQWELEEAFVRFEGAY